MEGSPPDRPGRHDLLGHVASHYAGGADEQVSTQGVERVATLTLSDVVVAILESRADYPLAASAAVIREPGGDGTVVHLVLLDGEQQPLFAGPGVIIAISYEVGQLDRDVLAAFGDRDVIILKLATYGGPSARPTRGAGRARPSPARPSPARPSAARPDRSGCGVAGAVVV